MVFLDSEINFFWAFDLAEVYKWFSFGRFVKILPYGQVAYGH